MGIEKLPRDRGKFHRPCRFYENARSAFSAFLRNVDFGCADTVLLPAYVGWSSREGSGVFDPVRTLGLPFGFYRLNERLWIDLEHLEHLLRTTRVRVFVIIHFFGYVDANYLAAIELARRYGAIILEDEAHAMLTDLVGGVSGRAGDACIYSLHKLLPTTSGGMLVVNDARVLVPRDSPEKRPGCDVRAEYDLVGIARRRCENALHLEALMEPFADHIQPLRTAPSGGMIPQTLPVLIRTMSRDQLYHEMNSAGFGVVSLYHTLIEQIRVAEFPVSHRVAHRILNLPVHQDLTPEDLESMVVQLRSCLERGARTHFWSK